jgi:toxin ParE1/3/4
MAAHRVVLSRLASRDIKAIRDYLWLQASPRAARKAVDQLLAAVGSLEANAHRGASVEELYALGQGPVRQLVSRPYRIIYHASPERVLVLLVCDGRRNVSALWQQRMLAWPV